MTVKRLVLLAYLACVHALLVALLVKDDAIGRLEVRVGLSAAPEDPFVASMRVQQARLDAAVPAGAVLFLGDSNTQSMPVSEIAQRAVNLGIAGQRSEQLLQSMAGYRSMQRAAAVVVMVGTNDVLNGMQPRFAEVLARVPAGVPVVLASVPPIADKDVRQVVAAARTACYARERCTFVDAFKALDGRPGVLLPDGVHLAPAGFGVLMPMLRGALAPHQGQP